MLSEPITVVIADDHPAILEAAMAQLGSKCQVVASAATGRDALDAIEQHQPTVAVLDMVMPDMSGLDVARQSVFRFPSVALVLFSAHADEKLAREASAIGVLGIVSKESPLADLSRAVLLASRGTGFVDGAIGGQMLDTDGIKLTYREVEVLTLLRQGLNDAAVGKQLSMSSETVRTHVRKATAKLHAKNRLQAVAEALSRGMID
jgi:DNA-binding NarL/FixJ family response regulator